MIYPPRHIDARDSAVERSLIKFLASHTVLWKDWPMDMSCRMLSDREFILSGTCPHCHTKALFMAATNSLYVEISIYSYELYAGMQCHACGKFILGSVALFGEHGEWEYHLHLPIGDAR